MAQIMLHTSQRRDNPIINETPEKEQMRMLASISACVGLGLLAASGPASAVSCAAGGTTASVDGTSSCAGPIKGNVPPYDLNDPSDSPDMGLGFSDWTWIEKDGSSGPELATGVLRVTLSSANTGQWQFTGSNGYGNLLLLLKFGNSFATFLVSGASNTWYDWSVVPQRGNGLSHMELYGRGSAPPPPPEREVPEPGSLALLGLGMVGLGISRTRRKA